ncbi:RNA-directed DNA polymerase [Amycolatopsis jejuensis]|uniref:RNA-directed DNA polymerase n=1 Tax=Amycolatopsis jejuensis TaxID=330084 RepID=UPI000A037225|nr:RNA-directed DNA polymerase [Amycolatopsis jejuensis]
MKRSSSNSLEAFLDIAWRNIGRASVDLDLPDIVNYADIGSQWETFKATLIRDFKSGDLLPLSVEIVDLPKDRIAVRPLARLDIARRLAYEAFVIAIAPEIGRITSKSVYSSRWWKKEQRMLSPIGWWIRMQKDARKFHRKNPDYFLARTDISSFFEHVDVSILSDDLRQLGVEPWAREALEQFLRAFNNMSSAWGIPQGPDMSGSLANLYLAPLDSELRRSGFRHFRYSDDMYIFGKDWSALRQILVNTNRTLRHRHLNLASSKTEIIASDKVLEHLEDREKDAINYGINVGMDNVNDDLHALFDRAIETESARDLKFCLTNLREIKDDYAIHWLLANFLSVPHIARQVLIYLSLFTEEQPHIGRIVARHLASDELALYPYAQCHIFVFLIRNSIKSRVAVDSAWAVLLDRNAETFLRETAARYLGLFSQAGESARLKQEYQVEPNSRVRRALLVACYESNQCSDEWLLSVTSADPVLALTADYLRSNPTFVPFPEVESPAWQ